jgi:enamine deaminase RidA (YjgF/YER057c/UK114 family)
LFGASSRVHFFREQATLVYANLKAATESVGGKMEDIVQA